jgi:S1-C subfamily serine protease
MLNLDMIGRNPEEPIAVVGDGYGTGVDALVMKAVGQSGLQSVTLGGTDYAGNSDHDAFYREDVPFLFFFAGLHEDYHQVGDHADKLAYERMFQIVQTGYHLLEPIADGQATPAFIHHINWLGVEIQQGMVAAVVDGSRASEVGFAVGDRLAKVGETAVTGDTIGPALRDIEPGTVTSFVLQRDGDRVELDVERAKTGYLGIYPGAPSDEQQQALGIVDGSGVLVRQLAEEGPAAQSGLQAGDIILQLSGQPISTRTLSTILQRIGAGEPVQCLVARAGERITIELVLGERPQR